MNSSVAIITGAASGIGLETARRLKQQGIKVFALDTKDIDLSGVEKIKCDISSEDDVIKAKELIFKKVECIDCLILAAGVLCCGERDYISDLTLDEWNGVLSVNLTGTMLCLKHFSRLLLNSKYKSIITFSSEQTIKIIKKSAPYLISKIGIEYLTKLAALELIESKVRVNCIRLASVDTPFLKTLVGDEKIREDMIKSANDAMPLGIITTSDVFEAIEFLLFEKSSKITGQVFTIDSGVLL